MRCYYRNDLSCGANRMEFKDQIVIKAKLDQKGIRPIRVPHFGGYLESKKCREREKKKKKKKKRKKAKKGMDCYGFVWIVMVLYGFIWILVCSISKV